MLDNISNYEDQIRGVSYKPTDLYDTLNESSIILLRANNINEGRINYDDVQYVDRKKVSQEQILQKGDILICASSGSKNLVGKAAQFYDDVECTFGAFCKVVRPRKNINNDYLGSFFQSNLYRKTISKLSLGANINNIRNEHIDSFKIDIPDASIQSYRAEVIRTVNQIITKYNQQLSYLDSLVKARFIQMFGEPVHNTNNLPILPMTEVCEIIDGDRGKNYPKQEEFYDKEYCLFLNAKNVTRHGFDFSECMFITKEKDEALRKGKLKRGDIILTTRGTLGNLAFYTDDVPYENMRINSGMVILRMNKQIIDEGFFIEQFRMQVDDIKKTVASGSAQPQLPISTMNKISVIMPDLREQKKFTAFVAQIDKSKFVIQQSLDETQKLFDSLMQEYFG